jgi:hypothetical protein
MKLYSRRWLTFGVIGMSIALGGSAGCIEPVSSAGSGGSGSYSSGNADAGPCDLSSGVGVGGSLVIPQCMEPHTAIFQGTLKGQPYNQTFFTHFHTGDFPAYDEPGMFPWHTVWEFTPDAVLQIEWTERMALGKFGLVKGKLTLPGEEPTRDLMPGSSVAPLCGTPFKKPAAFILKVDAGEFTGCATE